MEGEQEYDSIGLFAISGIMNSEAKEQLEDYEFHEAEKNFLQAIALNNDAAMMNLAVFYEENNGNHDDIIKYYIMAITASQCPISMYNLADYYKNINDIENMIKYFMMAIDGHLDIASMLCLSLYYHNINDYDNMKLFYIMALRNAPLTFIFERFARKFGIIFSPFVLLDILNSITEEELPTLQRHKQQLTINKHIICYHNKLTLFTSLNHIVDCGICYEDKLNINLSCGHCVCVDCYKMLYNKCCPFCRL